MQSVWPSTCFLYPLSLSEHTHMHYLKPLWEFFPLFSLFVFSFTDLHSLSFFHRQYMFFLSHTSCLSVLAGRNSWEGRGKERPAWETRAIWWLYGGVVGSGSIPSTTHPAAGAPHSLVWCRPAPSGFSQAALSGCSLLSPTPWLLLLNCAAVQ